MAWNDPQWGNKKGAGGPPDLDEIWRNFNQRLGRAFGGKGGGPTEAGPGSFGPAGAGVVFGLILLFWLASGFYIVDEGERGVVSRFGRYVETTTAGLHWHLPTPIEKVETVNAEQVRTVEVGYRNAVRNKIPSESLMLTDDENIVDIQFATQYVIKDPEDYLFNNREPDDSVLQAAETAMRQIVGRSSMDFVLYEGRAEIATRAERLMQDILDRYSTGIQIVEVTLQNAQPPEQVQAAFDDAVKAGQDRERLKSEGQAYANEVIPRARGQASRLLEEAQGYKQSVIAKSEGDASRFEQILTEYDKVPDVTRERLYLDAVQDVLANSSKVFVDQSANNSVLYLPLDKMTRREGQNPEPFVLPPADPPAAESTGGAGTWRSRDAFRSREREERP